MMTFWRTCVKVPGNSEPTTYPPNFDRGFEEGFASSLAHNMPQAIVWIEQGTVEWESL